MFFPAEMPKTAEAGEKALCKYMLKVKKENWR